MSADSADRRFLVEQPSHVSLFTTFRAEVNAQGMHGLSLRPGGENIDLPASGLKADRFRGQAEDPRFVVVRLSFGTTVTNKFNHWERPQAQLDAAGRDVN